MSAFASYPDDVRQVASAVFDVARLVIAAETSPDGTYPTEPVRPPPPPADAPLLARAGLDDTAALVLRILVAAELDRGVYRVLRRLAADATTAGTPVDAVVVVVEGLGGDPVAALRAFRPDAP